MRKIPSFTISPMSRLSPSQYVSMKSCPHKSLLAESFGKKPLLPISANSYVGTILHKMIELIESGAINSEEAFDIRFDEEVTRTEDELISQGFGNLIPLRDMAKDFTMKKILVKDYLKTRYHGVKRESAVKYYPEKWLESKDKSICGRIDLIIESNGEISLFDFKTGAITQDILDDDGESFSEIKMEYQEQMKIYAYLFFDSTGKIPSRIALVDLNKKYFEIPVSLPECKSIFDRAKELLSNINQSVRLNIDTANPTLVNCKFCLYRPACNKYLMRIANNQIFNDVAGTLVQLLKFGNGSIAIFLETKSGRIRISNLPASYGDTLSKLNGCKVAFFNLGKEKSNDRFFGTYYTVPYLI